ncbi:MAG: hypothetical protein ACE5HC_15725 [Candidatus Binatia bacterium]
MKRWVCFVFFIICALLQAPAKAATETIQDRIGRMEQELKGLRKELEAQKQEQAEVRKAVEEQAVEPKSLLEEIRERVTVGGYGSVRFESNDLENEKDTFTFRRFVLTVDAFPHDRLQAYLELEFERFSELELEKELEATAGGLKVVNTVEGTSGSEIAVEQAWLRYAIAPWLNLQMGAVLVPIGRFNLFHDDNRWNLPRRTLVDRGVPVIPVKAAWPELGVGFTGEFPVGEEGLMDYRLYVVNGAQFDFELESIAQTRDPKRDKLELEAEFQPSKGTFSKDLKSGKAFAGRLNWSPTLGHEVALSGYYGRYTPEVFASESIKSIGVDGFSTLGPFEVEYEYVYTSFGDTRKVAESFARVVREKSSAIPSSASPDFEAEIEFEPANLADAKQGYWIELRYPFWPEALNGTFFGKAFENPKLVPTLRWEQVFFDDLLTEVDFTGGALTDFKTIDRTLNRITGGIAYRPVPLWAFQFALEYTWANDSLVGLTNFLKPRSDEDNALAFLFGVAFGF